MSNTCFIVGAGEPYGSFKVQPGDYVIAADGGYNFLQKLNIQPDLFVGDCDSLDKAPKDIPNVVHNPIKDDTDTLIAINEGFARGYTNFSLYGCCGGRTDHFIANIQSLCYIAQKGGNAWLYGNNEKFTVVQNTTLVLNNDYPNLSVFSLSDTSYGVCETGTQYTLNNYTMHNRYPIGVSNCITSSQATISVQNGILLVCLAK